MKTNKLINMLGVRGLGVREVVRMRIVEIMMKAGMANVSDKMGECACRWLRHAVRREERNPIRRV